MRSHLNFTRVNKIETMYGRSRGNVKVEPRSTFTFTRGLLYIASSSFTRDNFRCVRTEKLCYSGNQLSGCVHTIRDSFGIYEHLVILSRDQRFSLRYKSRQNHLSCVWTEAISGMVIVPARKLSGVCQHSFSFLIRIAWKKKDAKN